MAALRMVPWALKYLKYLLGFASRWHAVSTPGTVSINTPAYSRGGIALANQAILYTNQGAILDVLYIIP